EGYRPADGERNPHGRFRLVGPKFFSVVGQRIVAGREFTDADTTSKEFVTVINQSIAQRFFANGDAVNHGLSWKEPISNTSVPTRIIGVVADVDDEHVAGAPGLTMYLPALKMGYAGRLFVRTAGDPYSLVPAVTRVVRTLAPDQPVERAATLEDVRVQVLSPERLNAFVLSGFAGIALLIAIVGVAGVLAFSVSARTREFGVRLAIGSAPRHVLARVVSEGVGMAALGVAAGAAGGFMVARVAARFVGNVELPGTMPVIAATAVMIAAAVAASLVPAARASRVDVIQALRSE